MDNEYHNDIVRSKNKRCEGNWIGSSRFDLLVLRLQAAYGKVILKCTISTYYDWPEESAAMQDELAALGGDHLAIQVDLRKTSEVKRLLSEINKRFGKLHILINNIDLLIC